MGNTDADSSEAMAQERLQYQKLRNRGGNEVVSINVAYNMDCMEYMKSIPDKAFDLAVVDPPYGINITDSGRLKKYNANKTKWDSEPPQKEYFEELRRVSKNQIIWGGNYFDLPPTRCFLIWDKQQPEGVTFSSCEFAWTSFDQSAKTFYYSMLTDKDFRFHPTQKPVALYAWIFSRYAKQGDKILDTHLGSGSSRIAAYDAGFDFVGLEIDKDYFDKQEERFAAHTAQCSLFVK